MSRIFDQLRQLEQEKAAQNCATFPREKKMGAAAPEPMPSPQAKPANRASRFSVIIPLRIRGKDADGKAFEEESRTIAVADNSMLIMMTHEVVLGDEIGIENLALGRSSSGRVVWRGETNEVAVHLSDVEEICGVKLSRKPEQS